jgi:hypothetical protein
MRLESYGPIPQIPNKLLAKRAIGRVKKFFEKALLKNPHI